MRLHHVQVGCPRGGEDDARRFYAEGLGMVEVSKPPSLAGRGGCWFRAYTDDGGPTVTAEIHVGVDVPVTPGRRAHPALLVAGLAELGATADRLESLGFDVDRAERFSFEGYERFHAVDAAGNRVEVMAAATARDEGPSGG